MIHDFSGRKMWKNVNFEDMNESSGFRFILSSSRNLKVLKLKLDFM
jgi:hypothetical protein